MLYFVSILLIGLSLGSIYALIAVGYTMVYGIIKLINFAHGEFYMFGAFIGYYVLTLDSWNKSIFAIFVEQAGSNCYFTLQAYLFGESGKNARQLKTLLTELTL